MEITLILPEQFLVFIFSLKRSWQDKDKLYTWNLLTHTCMVNAIKKKIKTNLDTDIIKFSCKIMEWVRN